MAVMLTPVTALTSWQFAPLVSAALLVLAALYLAGTRRVRRRHPAGPWPAGRSVSFLAGLAVIAVALQGADAVYDDVLLRAHMVQHLLLIMVAPPLLVYGRPVTLLLHATRNPWHARVLRVTRSRAVHALTWPPLGVLGYSAAVTVTHLTPFLLARGWAHDAQHVAYLATGYLLFLPVVGSEPLPRRPSVLGRYLLLLAAMPADIAVGAAYLVAGPFGGFGRADVHAAGLLMLAGGELIMTGMALVLAVSLVRERAPGEPAELDAYNARLASLEQEPSRGTVSGSSLT